MKQAYALHAGPLINPKFHVAATTVTVFDLRDKQSRVSHVISCVKNAMCELHMGTQCVHVLR
jgi:hypothetical protein